MAQQISIAVGVVAAIMAALFLVLPTELAFQFILFVMAVFLILLVLVQRGRGGGLAGALGGAGGSSAFGAKAGDNFTVITVVAVSIWVVTCMGASIWSANRGDKFGDQNDQLITSSSIASADEAGEAETPVETPDSTTPAADTEDTTPDTGETDSE